ncbi:LysM peptidoglycan-binding domain-containing protein [Paenibacillus sepulcri]|uniref:LysM peptidoglycan-binding domain-containing protein n=1 Tax=Paenibacillus sepulcri TaxID=359917 RepID=A0ABS7BZL8_9BACL|nr:LysM peptidoglycan-binding domain-containing protein [Paenibacillus sepulcri]
MMITISSYSSMNSENKADKGYVKSASDKSRSKKLVMRMIAAILFFSLLFVGFSIMQGSATSEHPAEPAAGEKVISISEGQTLWEIAGDLRKEGEDIRRIIYDLKERNNLTSSTLMAGQTLIIPAD